MATTTTVYCPRCDREFDSGKTRAASMKVMEEHLKKHPDYIIEDD